MISLDLNPDLETKAISLLGTDSNEFFERILNIEIFETKRAIKNLTGDLKLFESKYNISTEKFYSKWEKGEFGDKNDDFFEWSGEHELLREAQEKLKNLTK